MAPARQSRQYVRLNVDARVRLAICDSCATQVNPISGLSISGRMLDISVGGAGVEVSTYLPRATSVDLEIPPIASLPAGMVSAQVMDIRMVDREPRYSLGLRFTDQECEIVRRLRELPDQQGSDRRPPRAPKPRASTPAELPEHLPGWMTLLQQTGLAGADVLQASLRESNHDEESAAQWLVDSGCVSQRDLALARAESAGLSFVEPGDYRTHLENRKLIPEEMARIHGLFPLFVIDRIITLAVWRPLDLAVLDQIRLHTGCEVDPCLAGQRELHHLIEWAYGGFHEAKSAKASAADLVWADILKDVADAPAVKLVNVLLDQAANSRASDVHIDAEEDLLRVRFRIDGVLREVPAPPKSLLPAIVSRVKILAHMDIAETRKPQDGHFKVAVDQDEVEIRVSTLPSTDGEALVLRLLRCGTRLLSLDELGMDAERRRTFDRLIHLPHGMLLVTGPTGSGKTTTLYSALARVDRVRQSIITLEDPVEIRLPQIRQVSVNPKAGLTFQSGLRAILRQDPDCIMLGEIRDRETAEIALQAALTGHLVLSTLHTNSAAGAPARLLDMGVPDFLVASSLVGILAQRLCRRLCRHCARPAQQLPEAVEALAGDLLGDQPGLKAVGCKRCGSTGYDGRVGLFELVIVTEDVRRAILNRHDEQTIAALAHKNETRLLLDDGLDKIRRGLTTVQEVLRVVDRIDGSCLRKGPSAGRCGYRAAGSQTQGFDVAAYQRLLERWLRPNAAPTPAPVGGSC